MAGDNPSPRLPPSCLRGVLLTDWKTDGFSTFLNLRKKKQHFGFLAGSREQRERRGPFADGKNSRRRIGGRKKEDT